MKWESDEKMRAGKSKGKTAKSGAKVRLFC